MSAYREHPSKHIHSALGIDSPDDTVLPGQAHNQVSIHNVQAVKHIGMNRNNNGHKGQKNILWNWFLDIFPLLLLFDGMKKHMHAGF